MAWITQAVGLGLQVAGTIGANIDADKTRKKMSNLLGTDPTYTQSSYAPNTLAIAKNLYNGRMAGAAGLENGIYGSQANTLANVNRNATDGSQALAMGAATQGQTNQAFQNLAQMENQNKQANFQNVAAANQGMTEEHTKAFDDTVRKWQDQMGVLMARNAIRQQEWGNMGQLGQSISGAGSMGFGKK